MGDVDAVDPIHKKPLCMGGLYKNIVTKPCFPYIVHGSERNKRKL